ncbi:MAG: membrane protein insertase YidC [Betaproteobacteria bacterium HGW-Betaproteobacteria-8]|nr:MAG: membrane protein insertase YidC [Betaproteobacteria bacterium HGW-Betaproteobacteria-8]
MDTKRLILFVIFSFSVLMLWDSWQQKNAPETAAVTAQQQDGSIPQAAKSDLPEVASQADLPQTAGFNLEKGQRITIETDLYRGEIDTVGGDLRKLVLLQHRSDDKQNDFVLLDDAASPLLYVAQTGLIGSDLPTHRSVFASSAGSYRMADGSEELEVRLTWVNAAGLQVDKVYTFKRGSYAIGVSHQVINNTAAAISPSVYYQILHDNQSNQGSFMMPTFTGGAYFTDEDKFKKISFSDMAKSNLSKNSKDGWVALVQHYFLGAWIPKEGMVREFYTKQLSNNIYSIGSVSPMGQIAAGATAELPARFYAGPQTQSQLKAVAPGLEYAVDYGWLTIIAAPLFWVLSAIQKLVNNWGVAIILLTVLIKLAFYPLSAASYRSMAHLRELSPRLQSMKEKFGDDRQKMQQAMMELYKTEKINPLGGCLPILVQIPVFIALYWVLLGSVEMRHAPFMLWIQDLSAVDPYYVLPILMGLTMIIQTRLNPTPTDPIQAKVMMIMPVVFSVFFFFFPAGLVLYWLVNNILSIAQQWHINRATVQATAAKKKLGKR